MKMEIPAYNLEIKSIVFEDGDSIPDIDFSCFLNLSKPSFFLTEKKDYSNKLKKI